jgi:hypothetical protein
MLTYVALVFKKKCQIDTVPYPERHGYLSKLWKIPYVSIVIGRKYIPILLMYLFRDHSKI